MAKEFDLGTRLQALTLHSEGIPRRQILEKTGYSDSGFQNLLNKAKKNGYKPGQGPILRQYAETAPRKGRPSIMTAERKAKLLEILASDPAARKLSTQQLSEKFNELRADDGQTLSRRSVLRMLRSEGYDRPAAGRRGPDGRGPWRARE